MDDSIRESIFGVDRDAGKTFHVSEVPPLEMAGFMLRLASALRVPSYETLIDDLLALRGALPTALAAGVKSAPDIDPDAADALATATTAGAALNLVMQIVQRCDAQAVHTLIKETLTYVHISPDPKHPGAERALMHDDIREKTTLMAILQAFARVNIGSL